MLEWIKTYLLYFSGESSKNKIYFSRNIHVLSFGSRKAKAIYNSLLDLKVDRLSRKWKYNEFYIIKNKKES